MIVAEQYSDWEETKRRIDFLALDEDAHLVVVELKRDEDGGAMDLQALRYAALVANMTLRQLVDAHADYRAKLKLGGDAQAAQTAIFGFLGVESEAEIDFESAKPRIILVAADFSRELTTSAMWLNSVGIDIRCVRMRPHKLKDELVVDVVQIIPLPEQEDFLIRLRGKTSEEAATERVRREKTIHVLVKAGVVKAGTELVVFPGSVEGEYDAAGAQFKARVGENPTAQQNIIWAHDKKAYALTTLSDKLRREMGVQLWSAPSGYLCWSLATDTSKNLYQIAEEIVAKQRSSGSGPPSPPTGK